MSDSRTTTVTRLLALVRDGDRNAFDEVFPLVYDEMRDLARAQRRSTGRDDTLDTTAVVHEAYLRLVNQSSPDWKDRAHFLAVAARAMRHILIDYARRRQAGKRGGGRTHLSFNELESALASPNDPTDARDDALLALEAALTHLETENRRQGQIVECKFFGGMTIPETAEALGVSRATVERGWGAARAWLYRELERTLERGRGRDSGSPESAAKDGDVPRSPPSQPRPFPVRE